MNQTLVQNLLHRNSEIEHHIISDIRTGLVVQGGGMRGIYSMAALMAIEECKLTGAFDHVFGSSAGAINGAYLLAEQAKLAVTVYLDDISNKNFVNFLRVQKIVDIDFLVDQVLKKHKALDVKKVMKSRALFHLVLTDVLTGEPAEFTNRDNKDFDLMETLRATAAMPILYNKIVQINGRGYVDGGLLDAVPLMRAIQTGCTDIVVVLTREPSFRRRRPNLFLRLIEQPFLTKLPAATRKLMLSEDKYFNRTMELIEQPEKEGFTVRIAVVYPSDISRMVSRTTHNREALLDCALMARNDMRVTLGFEPLSDNPFPPRPS
ncbi:MAG: patatin family protein [Bacteroidota bacterium]